MSDPQIQADVERVSNEVLRYKSGELGEEEWRRFRLQNGVYGIRFQKDIQMVRVKVPYGEVNSEQLRILGDIAEIFSMGIGHITTRQDIQFHWVALEAVPEVLRRLCEVGLTTREACGNTVRNVTACPLAGVCPKEVFDVTPYAKHISRYLLRNPLTQNLPRKFKVAFSGCGDDCIFGAINDVGALATVKSLDGQQIKGFRIYIGGGLGSPPRAAHLLEEFTPAEDLDLTCEALIRVFDRMGNRDNIFRARMKFVIDRVGIDEFRRLIFKERQALRVTKSGDPATVVEEERVEKVSSGAGKGSEGDAEFQKWFRTNAEPQKQKGFYAVYVTLFGGDLTARQFRVLADIAERYADSLVRTTVLQDMVLRWVDQVDLYDLYADMKKVGLASPGANTISDVVGCPGADTCNLGVTRSHRLAMKLSEHLSEQDDIMLSSDLEGVSIKVSGCPNACGQHHVATIGLFGSAQRVDGRMVPYYQLLLGGSVSDGVVRFGEPVMRVPAKRVPEAVSKLIDLYREQKMDGENFLSWVERLQSEGGEQVG